MSQRAMIGRRIMRAGQVGGGQARVGRVGECADDYPIGQIFHRNTYLGERTILSSADLSSQ